MRLSLIQSRICGIGVVRSPAIQMFYLRNRIIVDKTVTGFIWQITIYFPHSLEIKTKIPISPLQLASQWIGIMRIRIAKYNLIIFIYFSIWNSTGSRNISIFNISRLCYSLCRFWNSELRINILSITIDTTKVINLRQTIGQITIISIDRISFSTNVIG